MLAIFTKLAPISGLRTNPAQDKFISHEGVFWRLIADKSVESVVRWGRAGCKREFVGGSRIEVMK